VNLGKKNSGGSDSLFAAKDEDAGMESEIPPYSKVKS